MTEKDIRYRELLAHQLAMNRQSWAALVQLGLTPDTEVRLDFAYRAPSQRAAEALRSLLLDQTDYDVEVRSESLIGTTQSTTISPEILDEWVDWMVTAGLEHDCDFDGWGTEV